MSATVEIAARYVRDTGQAVLIDDGAGETWVPKSQIENLDRIGGRGETHVFEIAEWFAEQAGLI